VNEESAGISKIADETMNIVNETSGSAGEVEQCKRVVADLNDIIHKFKL
jgi:hypothetical protein